MVKYKKLYYFNDGYDGAVVAKSLKQAVNILCKNGYKGMKKEILAELKKPDEDKECGSWYVDMLKTVSRKSGMVGWYE
jgi:hypothetical protein